jgi:hypothetical protein
VKRIARGLFIAFMAALAGYVTWDRIEAYRLNAAIKRIAARGEPIDLSSRQTPSTAQEQEAAQLYADAASRAREMVQQDGRLTRIDVDGVVGRVDVGEIESTFRKDSPPLQLLDRATPLPFAGFGGAIEDDQSFSVQWLEALSALACLRADLLAYRGDGDAAAASLVAAARVQRTLSDGFQKSLAASRQVGSLRILLRHAAPSAEALERLQAAFAEMPDEDLIEHDMLLRRATMIDAREEWLSPLGLSAAAAVAVHPFLVRRLRVQIDEFPEALAASRAPWPDKIGVMNAMAFAEPYKRRTPLAEVVSGPIPNVAAMSAPVYPAAARLVVRRVAVTALAIERYRRAHDGAPPSDLGALVPGFMPAVPIDPFSGQPIVYKPSTADYLLYSVDTNRKDDGGQIYGIGSLNAMPLPRVRDLGIRVPLIARPVKN